MTVKDFIQLIIRRWYVFAAGIACAAIAMLAMQSEPLIFVANTEITMISPGTSADFEPPGDTGDTLISFADVIARKYNDAQPSIHLSSPSATLFGNGVRSGSSVRLLNTGTQWQAAFSGPVITIQVLGSSDAEVREQLDVITGRLKAITREVQDQAGPKAGAYITVQTDETRIETSSFGPTRTSKMKGDVLLVCFSICISMLVARGLDAWNGRRSKMRFVRNPAAQRQGSTRETARERIIQ